MKKTVFKLEYIAYAILILYALSVSIFSFNHYVFAICLISLFLLSRKKVLYGVVGSIFLILATLLLPHTLETRFDDLTLYLIIPLGVVAMIYLDILRDERKKAQDNAEASKSKRRIRVKIILGGIAIMGVAYFALMISFGFGGEPFGVQMAEIKISDYIEDKYGEGFSNIGIEWNFKGGCYVTTFTSTKFDADFVFAMEMFPYDLQTEIFDVIIEASYCDKDVDSYLHVEAEVINNDANIEVGQSRAMPYEIAGKVIEPLKEEYGGVVCLIVYVDRNGRFEIDNTYYNPNTQYEYYDGEYDYREVLIDNPFEIIEFADKGFEKFIRENLELGAGVIRRKDIAQIRDLQFYSVTNYKINSLEDLKLFASLEYLAVADDDVTVDLKYLSELKNLWSIQVDYGTVKGDLGSLSNLTKLDDVDISGPAITGDLSSLSSLTRISRLRISNAPITGNLSSLSRLYGLERLDVSRSKISGDISALSANELLREINLRDTGVSGDICSLQHLTQLEQLNVTNTDVSGDPNCLDASTILIGI